MPAASMKNGSVRSRFDNNEKKLIVRMMDPKTIRGAIGAIEVVSV